MTENLYCPKWIFDVCTASCAESFINDIPLDVSCKKFTRGLNKRYNEIKLIEFKYGAESLIQFMGELKKPQFEPYEGLRQFIFFTIKYERKFFISKRKFKTLFGSAFDGTKSKDYSEDKTLQDFKKYIYSLRANLVDKAPRSWEIQDESEELDFVGELILKNNSFF